MVEGRYGEPATAAYQRRKNIFTFVEAVSRSLLFTATSSPVAMVAVMNSPESYIPLSMGTRKRVALVAHDNRKSDLLDRARFNRGTLAMHDLFATGTTGAVLSAELELSVTRFLSGPLGGDQQIGAAIVEGRIDFVIFFWDPLEPHPHDVDVKALLRIAVVYNVPIACNRSTADFLLSSPLMHGSYERRLIEHSPPSAPHHAV
jgi:methylglyoxal synthase